MNIDAIIENLTDVNVSLSQSLLKVKVLLHTIGDKDLNSWIEHELNGYSKGDKVPEYRIIPSRVVANFNDGYTRYSNHPIPLSHLDEDVRNKIQQTPMGQSVAVLEDLVKNSKNKTFAKQFDFQFIPLLQAGLDHSFVIEMAQIEVTISQLLQVLTQIRTKLLNALLPIRERFPNSDHLRTTDLNSYNSEIKELFQSAVFGDNTTILIGDNGIQSVSINQVNKNDFDSLTEYLKCYGVKYEDINELNNAIKNDGERTKVQGFGEKVKNWMKAMWVKAVDASWQVELSIAGNLLTTGLMKYYGW